MSEDTERAAEHSPTSPAEAAAEPVDSVVQVDGEAVPAFLSELMNKLANRPAPELSEPAEQIKVAIEELRKQADSVFARISRYLETQVDVLNHAQRQAGGDTLIQAGKDFNKANAGVWASAGHVGVSTGLSQALRAIEQPTHF